ncbi:hypothetical protein SAMN04488543_3052 [Friedmanniella luteola]|uniref:Uncharacterized protein n=1 Tax=Friedmanniella luteola TaxID=546871 RepID=A0A1H1XQ65_9ACTN|nr:hypothetical protein [Friedmanniella luteola]SDT10926.1 hypothetical protein SAMN04488543_3052 [Friedmanniella luteola]
MALVDSVTEWVQIVLNAGAIVTGGIVWKMYFENLKATIGTKDAERALASKQVDYWREKAVELEKRSPEAVERVLADRISIREDEIARLTNDKNMGSEELQRVTEEVKLLQRDLDQTKGFRAVLAMEQPDPDDPEYEEYLEYLADREDGVVEMEVVFLGTVGVDSGQLMITDPFYVDDQWQSEPYLSRRSYRDTQTGAILTEGEDFAAFDQPLEILGGAAPKDLIVSGRLAQLPDPEPPETFKYSYNGACQATLSRGYGELLYRDTGEVGAGVAFQSGWGDGFYGVFGEKHDGRIVRVYVNCGADPVALAKSEPEDSTPAPTA